MACVLRSHATSMAPPDIWFKITKKIRRLSTRGRVCPLAATSGGAWAHYPPREKPGNRGWSVLASSPLPFPAGGEEHCHLQQEKNTSSCFILFFSQIWIFRVCFSIFLPLYGGWRLWGQGICGRITERQRWLSEGERAGSRFSRDGGGWKSRGVVLPVDLEGLVRVCGVVQ